jgi:CO/xanthine dehydrogenase FAD-binding subunit
MHARPHSLEHALELLQQRPWSILAGGTDFYPGLRDQAPTGAVIDITSIEALRQISTDGGAVRIGALATWSALVAADLPPAFDAIKAASLEVGSLQIQNRATVVGNLCNASPAADGVPPLLCLDAEVELTSVSGCRRVPLDQFIVGNRKTVRKPDELVTAIIIPAIACTGHSAFIKLGARRYLVISISMVAANIALSGAGAIDRAAVAVGSCSEVARRLSSLEHWLHGRQSAEVLANPATDALTASIQAAVAADLAPIDDVRATADYRIQAASELVSRAVFQAIGQAAASGGEGSNC